MVGRGVGRERGCRGGKGGLHWAVGCSGAAECSCRVVVGMNRRESINVCEARQWRGIDQRRASSRQLCDGWAPVETSGRTVATSEWRVHTESHRADGMPGLQGTYAPLHCGTAADLRRLEEGKDLVRPVPSSSVAHLMEYHPSGTTSGSHEERIWDQKLWSWRPKPGARQRGRSQRPSVSVATAVVTSRSEPTLPRAQSQSTVAFGRTLHRTSTGIDASTVVQHTAETKEIDSMRGGISELQLQLGSDMLSQALARMRKKLVSKFAAMQAFHQIDVDCSGYLDQHEFAAALNRLGVKLGKAQVELVFLSIDVDGSGEIDCEEFLDKVFKPDLAREDEAAKNSSTGLAKWSAWVAPVRKPGDAVKYVESSFKVQTRQHDLMRRPASTDSWPSSMLHDPGYRSSAEIETALIASQPRDLPQINPANHPKSFFKNGDERHVQNVLNTWNNRFRYSRSGFAKVKPSQKGSHRIANQMRQQLRKFESWHDSDDDGDSSDSDVNSDDEACQEGSPQGAKSAKDVYFWMTPNEIQAAKTMKLRRYEDRAAAANAAVQVAKDKAEKLAREGATRMDKAYFDQRSAAEEALAGLEHAANEAARALVDARHQYGDGHAEVRGDDSC